MADAEGSKKSVSPLIAIVESIRQKAKERALKNPPTVEIVQKSLAPVFLPAWPEMVRGIPNSLLRSALFGAARRGKRVYMQRVPLASVDGVTILFSGPQLDQADLDVWEQCMHISRTVGLGTRIYFSTYAFLKKLKRSTGGKDVEWLKCAFARLSTSAVEIQDGKKAYFGPMLHYGARDEESGQYCIEINQAIASLYGADGWTQIEWEQRQALKRQPLAQWLHGFYSTHAKPYPYKVETIHKLCGSENQQTTGFRRELREALIKLEEATGWSWEIDDADLLHIQKKPTASQSRHLIAKKPNKPRRGLG